MLYTANVHCQTTDFFLPLGEKTIVIDHLGQHWLGVRNTSQEIGKGVKIGISNQVSVISDVETPVKFKPTCPH